MESRNLLMIFCCVVLSWIVVNNWSCKKPDNYPIDPHIEFLGFEQQADSAVFRISFTDGDGDIGLAQKDTFPPFNSKSPHYNNFVMKQQYLDTITGKYEYAIIPGTLHDTLSNSIRIDRIKKVGTESGLNGELQVYISTPYSLNKYFRYECYLEDRALHRSNLLVTPTFTLKQ